MGLVKEETPTPPGYPLFPGVVPTLTWCGQGFMNIDGYDTQFCAMMSKIEKVPRGIRGEKSSKDMASSRNLVSTIGALASPKMGDGTRCPEG